MAQTHGRAGFREDYAASRPAEFLGYVAPPVEFLGGIALVLGFATRYAALLMLLFTVIATLSSHRWWNYPVEQQTNQHSHFWKNVSMMGGIIVLFVTAAGRWSIDGLLRRRNTA